MPEPTITAAVVWEDTNAIFLARVLNWAGAAITQASTTSISRTITNLTTGVVTQTATALTIATAVYDTYQTGAIWTVDSTGYNFYDAIGAALFLTAGNVYRVEYLVTPASGGVFRIVYNVTAKGIEVS